MHSMTLTWPFRSSHRSSVRNSSRHADNYSVSVDITPAWGPGHRAVCLTAGKYRGAGHELRVGGVGRSESFQKIDQRPLVIGGKLQAELMPFHRPRLHLVPFPSRRHVVVPQTARIEPVLEGCDRTIVLERAAIPHPFE